MQGQFTLDVRRHDSSTRSLISTRHYPLCCFHLIWDPIRRPTPTTRDYGVDGRWRQVCACTCVRVRRRTGPCGAQLGLQYERLVFKNKTIHHSGYDCITCQDASIVSVGEEWCFVCSASERKLGFFDRWVARSLYLRCEYVCLIACRKIRPNLHTVSKYSWTRI